MAQMIINIGTVPNDGTGDPLRNAFNKANSNFTELYSQARTQRLVTSQAGLDAISNADRIVLCNIATGSPTFTLPASATRAGAALTFKDVGGQFLTHQLTLSCFGAETIDGQATWVLQNNYAALTVNPRTDGGSGWFVT